MSFKRIAAQAVILVGICSTPVIASAADLVLNNNVNLPNTTLLYNDSNGRHMCSSNLNYLGLQGVTPACTGNSPNVVGNTAFRSACRLVNGFSATTCKVKVFMSADCSGNPIADVSFDINNGLPQGLQPMLDNNFSINVDSTGFGITLDTTLKDKQCPVTK